MPACEEVPAASPAAAIAACGSDPFAPVQSGGACPSPDVNQPNNPIETLLRLASQKRVVPVFAAGTTMNFFGTWNDLCPRVWQAAVQANSELNGQESEDHMENIERIRSSLGDAFVAEAIRIYFKECTDAKHQCESPEQTVDQWLQNTGLLGLQRQVGEAGFPCVVTTNFDECLERSGKSFRVPPLYRRHLQVPGGEHTSYFVAAVDSAPAAGTPLLKIQGDVTEDGQSEMIMGYEGHSNYNEELMPLREFLRHRNASCVFYGASLRIEANWKLILETLCPSSGEDIHFRITFGEEPTAPNIEHRRRLWSEHRVCTINMPDMESARKLWSEICKETSVSEMARRSVTNSGVVSRAPSASHVNAVMPGTIKKRRMMK